MDDARLLGPELDLAALDRLNRLGDFGRHRPQLGVGHQAPGAEDLAQPSDHAHHVRRRDTAVEIDLALFHLFRQILRADHIGAGVRRLLRLVALGEDGNANGLAGAVRQAHDAAHHLVGVTGIDAEIDRNFDRFIELGLGLFLDYLDRLGDIVNRFAVDGLIGTLETLSQLAHRLTP